MAPESCISINALMGKLREGSPEAAGKLVELFYPELRRLAVARMAGERLNHTWQPTALLNEFYLELTKFKSVPLNSPRDKEERDAFLSLAAFLMKRLLVYHARSLPKRVTMTQISEFYGLEVSGEQSLHEVEDLLSRLGAIDPKLRVVVEMKAFEGRSREEIAEILGCSVRTVARHWEFAQTWLQRVLAPQETWS